MVDLFEKFKPEIKKVTGKPLFLISDLELDELNKQYLIRAEIVAGHDSARVWTIVVECVCDLYLRVIKVTKIGHSQHWHNHYAE